MMLLFVIKIAPGCLAVSGVIGPPRYFRRGRRRMRETFVRSANLYESDDDRATSEMASAAPDGEAPVAVAPGRVTGGL